MPLLQGVITLCLCRYIFVIGIDFENIIKFDSVMVESVMVDSVMVDSVMVDNLCQTCFFLKYFKDCVSSGDHPCKDGNARYTTVSNNNQIKCELDIQFLYVFKLFLFLFLVLC